MALAVIDVDGVVADVRHRLHHLRGRRDWPAFFAGAAADPLLAEGAAAVAGLAADFDVVWLTGRPEWLRDTTESWLRRHDLPGDELHMRPAGDRRPARVVKLAVLRALRAREIAIVLDDDPEVIAAVSAAGYPGVLADWVPRDDPSAGTLREAQERLGRT